MNTFKIIAKFIGAYPTKEQYEFNDLMKELTLYAKNICKESLIEKLADRIVDNLFETALKVR